MAGPQLRKIFGVPGSGKTTECLNTLEKLLTKGVPPERIAYLTFTRNAREEAMARVMKRFGFKIDQLLNFRTIHSICFQQLGLNKSLVVNTSALKEFSAKYGFPMSFGRTHAALDEDMMFESASAQLGDKYLAFDHWMRHKLLDFETAYKLWPDNLPYHEVEQFCRVYRRWREEEQLSDFTDFLTDAKFPLNVDYMFVDEAQDLSDLQWKVVKMFWQKAKKVYIAGDDDQAIFTWAGATPEIFIDMEAPTKVLDYSYRLPRTVAAFAQGIANQISHRQAKTFRTRDEAGTVRYVNSISDIEFTRDQTWKILVRNNYLKTDIKKNLAANGVPFSNTGYFAVNNAVLRAMFNWQRLVKGEGIEPGEAVEVYNSISSRIGIAIGGKKKLDDIRKMGQEKITMPQLREKCGLLVPPKTPWYDALSKLDDEDVAYLRSVGRNYGSKFFQDIIDLENKAKRDIPGLVDIYTIHAAKGSEADNVVILGEMAGRCQHQLATNPDPELRVWFTGVTRAKQNLYIVGSNQVLDA